jgi:hypothetical protein
MAPSVQWIGYLIHLLAGQHLLWLHARPAVSILLKVSEREAGHFNAKAIFTPYT